MNERGQIAADEAAIRACLKLTGDASPVERLLVLLAAERARARAEAFEEAAKWCEAQSGKRPVTAFMAPYLDDVASGIRRLVSR